MTLRGRDIRIVTLAGCCQYNGKRTDRALTAYIDSLGKDRAAAWVEVPEAGPGVYMRWYGGVGNIDLANAAYLDPTLRGLGSYEPPKQEGR
jgi:hypothetical protein